MFCEDSLGIKQPTKVDIQLNKKKTTKKKKKSNKKQIDNSSENKTKLFKLMA